MKTKVLLIITTLLVTTIVFLCTKAEFGSSIIDIIGTEWSYSDSDGTLGLIFYSNNVVTSFLDNKYGIETLSGTYEYIRFNKNTFVQGAYLVPCRYKPTGIHNERCAYT